MNPSTSSDGRRTGFCLLLCLLCFLFIHPSNPWMSPAPTDAMPWVHRGLSSGPCKPHRPLFMVQPNGYAKLPFVWHRHDRHKRPRLLSSRRRTQACCSGTRELAWLLSLCSRRETCPLTLLPPLREVSYHSGRPFVLRSAMTACIMSSPQDKARVLHMHRC